MSAHRPIGIFDSGVGGLTVAAAISVALPREELIYFGDTAHTPWGSQSKSAIEMYAARITETLLEQKCKAIVVACNTASAAALQAVQQVVGNKALIFNVIDPIVEYLAANFDNQKVGLIGTKQTIKSQAYATKLQQACPSINLNSLATPLLAPLIEEGFSNNSATKEFIEHYLQHQSLQDINALILGCTHYPLIKSHISDYYAGRVKVLDSAEIVARAVEHELASRELLNTKENAKRTFYVSHDSSFFARTAQQFFPGEIKLETYPLWD